LSKLRRARYVRWRTVPAPPVAHHAEKQLPSRSTVLPDRIENLMTLLKGCSLLFAAASLLLVLGCASTSKQESTGELLDDSVITSKVKTAIFSEPSLKVLQIHVETTKNVVQLSGTVTTRAEMNKAVEVTRSVGGVRSVRNDLQLK